MKDKIMYLIIGILIGAIIATAGFLIYNKSNSNNTTTNETVQMSPNGQMGEPPSGNNMGEPPAKPDGDNGEEPPAKPSGDNNQTPPAKPDETNQNQNTNN